MGVIVNEQNTEIRLNSSHLTPVRKNHNQAVKPENKQPENGKKYYYKNGEKQRGIVNIDGKHYYFKWYTYDLYTEGWLYFIPYDKYVYADRVTGEFLTGKQKVAEGPQWSDR